MKKFEILLILSFLIIPSQAQIKHVTQFVPQNVEQMDNTLKSYQVSHDKNKAYIKELIAEIFELKYKSNDNEFTNALDAYYKKLREYDDKPLAFIDDELYDIYLGINEEIDKYNSKIKILNSRSYDPTFDIYYFYKTTFDNPFSEVSLYELPNIYSKVIFKCPKDANVFIIEYDDELWRKVCVDGYIGYITKSHFKRQTL